MLGRYFASSMFSFINHFYYPIWLFVLQSNELMGRNEAGEFRMLMVMHVSLNGFVHLNQHYFRSAIAKHTWRGRDGLLQRMRIRINTLVRYNCIIITVQRVLITLRRRNVIYITGMSEHKQTGDDDVQLAR